MNPQNNVFRLIQAVTLAIVFTCGVSAQIPRTLSYQGILSDTAGVPKSNGNYAMTFRLYIVAQGGSPLWSETQILGTSRGLFNAVLGDVTPFPDSLRFDRRYWLGIQVSPDPELTPRIQLTATGYSINSRTADTAQYARTAPGLSIADSARIAGTIPNNSITSGKIASGQVVKSLNNLHDAVTLRAQGGATITANGDTITINSGVGGGGTGIQGIQNTDNTLVITNPTGPTATVNTRVPFSLNGNWNGEQGALQVLGDKPTIRLTGGAISGNESWIMHLGSDGPGNLSFFRRSGAATWTNVMSLATNGNVGIGTAGPRTPLELNGKLLITSQDAMEAVGNQPYVTLTDASTGYRQSRIQGANGDFYFYPSGSAAMTIKSGSGNVGIGTLSPSSKLEVETANGVGVSGNSSTNDGVVGTSSISNKSGVWGRNDVSGGVGVAGSSSNGTGVSGSSPLGVGVLGQSTSNNGVRGISTNSSGMLGSSANSFGVYGTSQNGDGVYGSTGIVLAHGVIGSNISGASGSLATAVINGSSVWNVGAYGGGAGDHTFAVFGQSPGGGPNQYAGWFNGYVFVNGTLGASDKMFRIDHPLDPGNKYLSHSCVESSDRMNIYNGNITTDANGNATVEMPNWFEALNIDFRYQLTIIGDKFAQVRVSKKISGNRFSIKTDKPSVEVSWQVTGIRNDAYAKAHPMQVEVDKVGAEKGTYTHPELYGLPPKTFDFKPAGQIDQTKKEKQ